MDWDFIHRFTPMYVKAAGLTLSIGLMGIGLSLLVGFGCCMARYFRVPVLRQIAKAYIELARNTPLLVQQRIGMVFHSYDLFPHMDVMANLLLCPIKVLGKSRREVTEEAERFLVRAMLMHPEMLLAEIIAALDPEMVREVLNVVLDLARDGVTMAIVTHEMRFAEAVADRVVFLEDGGIVEQAPPEKFFHQPETERAQQFLDTFDYKKS